MSNSLVATAMCSALALIGATGFAYSDTIGRYECSIVGIGTPEPIGDRAERLIELSILLLWRRWSLEGSLLSRSSRQRVGWSSRQLLVGGRSSQGRRRICGHSNDGRHSLRQHEGR